MDRQRIQPGGTDTSHHGYPALDPDSYTAGRLKHATPEHLSLTTRRFFIGPIPEGWLNSNRKSWYKRRVELSRWSTRAATFTAEASDVHRRTLTGLEGPSTAARMSFSFPQPADLDDESGRVTTEVEGEGEYDEDTDDDVEVQTTAVEPLNTHDAAQILGITDDAEGSGPRRLPVPRDRGRQAPEDQGTTSPTRSRALAKSSGQATSVTARDHSPPPRSALPERTEIPDEQGLRAAQDDMADRRMSAANPENVSGITSSNLDSPYPGETSSGTALLPSESPKTLPPPAIPEDEPLLEREPAPTDGTSPKGVRKRSTTGVRFDVGARLDQLAEQEERVRKRIDTARERLTRNAGFRRNTLQEGAIVKLEKMLVRVDVTMQEVPPDYDENDSLKTDTRTQEKWREFLVVVRKSSTANAEDFRLQMYKTRVIPNVDTEKSKKKPVREVRLDPKTTKVNLYSALDKTVVIWHPYKKGTRIVIMRPRSIADSVEWYTFLRDALGWKRAKYLQIGVPDLHVSLRLEKPFEGLETAGLEATDEQSAVTKTMQAEQAIAGKIIQQCIEMLEGDPEWASVLKMWSETAKMGLAWKRYDRLEWVHGANEQRMYGTMAMLQSYDLELRPKEHYPTCTTGKLGGHQEEPAPVEGFLIRLTSQTGRHQRMGRTFYKRLYYATHNQFITFHRPAIVTPPHPPRLATIYGSNIPTAHEIVEKSPTMFDVAPFPFQNGEVTWLTSKNHEYVAQHDREALEEGRRCMANLECCDGYIDMCHITHVRHIHEDMHGDAGSDDVDFHEDVPNTLRPDGATSSIDNDRVFELVLKNGLVIRLQAYNQETRDEWIRRLRALVKYWKRRTTADMDLFKSVRRANLDRLHIDEKMEAIVGQFAQKWEVSRCEASPTLFHMCGIAGCRPITLSALLYRKPRLHGTFERCGVILAGGKLMVFKATVRTRSGQQVRHIHQDRMHTMDLRDCYVYSGLLTEADLLYTHTNIFDPDHPGVRALPRVYLDDAWTSSDEDIMTTFVVWQPTKKRLFRAIVGMNDAEAIDPAAVDASPPRRRDAVKHQLRRVSKLGVPGRGVVFKCRSRAERDHWVLSVGIEIERLVEGRGVDARFMDEKGKS